MESITEMQDRFLTIQSDLDNQKYYYGLDKYMQLCYNNKKFLKT